MTNAQITDVSASVDYIIIRPTSTSSVGMN